MRRWSQDPNRNLLAQHNLECVRKALQDGGVVFGWHYYCRGGCSGEAFAFSDFGQYYDNVVESRAGDHFAVYALDELLDRAVLRIGDSRNRERFQDLEMLLKPIKGLLAGGRELAVVWRYIDSEAGHAECEIDTLWDVSSQEWSQFLDAWQGRKGELVFFTVALLDEDEQGAPVDGVSVLGDRRRVHTLVDGKRPDRRGATPETGPY